MLAFTIKNLKAFDLKYLNSNYTGTPKKKLKKLAGITRGLSFTEARIFLKCTYNIYFSGYICHKSHKRSLFFLKSSKKAILWSIWLRIWLEVVTVFALEVIVPLRLLRSRLTGKKWPCWMLATQNSLTFPKSVFGRQYSLFGNRD